MHGSTFTTRTTVNPTSPPQDPPAITRDPSCCHTASKVAGTVLTVIAAIAIGVSLLLFAPPLVALIATPIVAIAAIVFTSILLNSFCNSDFASETTTTTSRPRRRRIVTPRRYSYNPNHPDNWTSSFLDHSINYPRNRGNHHRATVVRAPHCPVVAAHPLTPINSTSRRLVASASPVGTGTIVASSIPRHPEARQVRIAPPNSRRDQMAAAARRRVLFSQVSTQGSRPRHPEARHSNRRPPTVAQALSLEAALRRNAI